ncbi:uncharacterized protein LOC106174227 isoform X2 [Lingula anatina]|uniref:Uncharacterized protein LOC106174227 isoform X2 n=1 Tax=Lingula anatina TaxID=7574 RepID=A0A1S3JMJ2_LINAN|nr:uncharacterized protein LOC106174227 isoform X2 [Lingula anatina]XP_013411125.1 uncharacterized protein LOC106174227 isoform X2 [Lingula anatina]|eukprot:XP_013411124.1 uncharacterized protein LOC106174227 isoform X2 [Lingula anatina]
MESEEVEAAEKEPLKFAIDLDAAEPQFREVLGKIKEVAEKLLYHWKSFPIILPGTFTESSRNVIELKDLFIAPTFDELDEVAMDESGEAKKLNEKQLQDVWHYGEFEVDSIHFPGQVHRWRLTQLLQKGSQRARESLLNDTALALRLLIITAKNRFHSQFFSLTQSAHAWFKGIWKLLDIFIGMPSNTSGNLGGKIREERMKHLVAELAVKPISVEEWIAFCEFVKEKCDQIGIEKFKTTDLKPPSVPCLYQTPNGQDLDLRLFNRDLMNKCMPLLSSILEQEAKGWYVQYRDRLMNELKEQELSREEISKQLNEAVMEEYLRRVYSAILANQELERLQRGIGQLLVNQAKAILVMTRAVDRVEEKMNQHRAQLKKHLETAYPVKSRIPAWVNEQLHNFEVDFTAQHLLSAHEEAIQMCREKNLTQALYFLQRDFNFIKDRETVLRKELSKVKYPTREFHFSTRIWLPQNWIVKQHLYGESEVIPTVITDVVATNIQPATGADVPSYSLEQYTRRKTTTRIPFWRWWNYLNRTWAWMWNAMFVCSVAIPWYSPLSLRALFVLSPFYANLELNRSNGTIGPAESSMTQTLASRLGSLWQHVAKSRRQFEAEPDRGFLGKSFTRHLNRFWNYVLKGAIGTFGLCLFFPPLCLIVSLLSFVAGVTTPLWMPVGTLMVHIASFLFFDFDRPDTEHNAVMILMEALIWRILILGCLQPVAAFFSGTILFPLGAFFIMLGGLVRRGGRGVWDTLMYHLVIKKRGRVPAHDGFVAKRTAGPGLASNYFFQIRPEQALAALESEMERHELEAWQENILKTIEKPLDEYRAFTSKVFQPFSAGLVREGAFKTLSSEVEDLKRQLSQKVEERKKILRTGLTSDLQQRIKLTDRDLKLTLSQAAKLVENFYPSHVINKLRQPEDWFWEKRQLVPGDFIGLACLLLKEIFSPEFLVALEETDNIFKLKIAHLNLARYASMLGTAEIRDDLEVVIPVHLPKGEINVEAPTLDIVTFDPNAYGENYSTFVDNRRWRRKPWKRAPVAHGSGQKLEIPLPVPHPANIAIMIYNRMHGSSLCVPREVMWPMKQKRE